MFPKLFRPVTHGWSELFSPTPLSFLDAAAWTQIGLFVIVCVSARVVWMRTRHPGVPMVPLIICPCAFAVVFLLCIMLRSWLDVVFLGLMLDLVVVAVLVGITGGSEVSAFVPFYLMLPTFGLAASEPVELVAALYILAVLLFLLTLFVNDHGMDVFNERGNKIAMFIITVACFGGTFYLDGKSREISSRAKSDLDTLRAKYEVGIQFDDLQQKLASADYDRRHAILLSVQFKHVNWKVRFQKWYSSNKDSDGSDPNTLRFWIQEPRRLNLLGNAVVDLKWIYSYPPSFEPGQELQVSGILVSNSYNVTVLATDLRE